MFLVGRSSENREGAAEPKMDVHEVEAGRCHGLTTQQDLMGPMIGDWFEFTVWFLSSSMSGKRYEVPESKPAGQKNGPRKVQKQTSIPFRSDLANPHTRKRQRASVLSRGTALIHVHRKLVEL